MNDKDVVDAYTKSLMEENELLNELAEEYTLEKRRPGDVSADDMAKRTGLTSAWCGEILRSKYKAGKLLRVKVMGEIKGSVVVYRKP